MKIKNIFAVIFAFVLIVSNFYNVSASSSMPVDTAQNLSANYLADVDACTTVNLVVAEDTHMRSGTSRGSYNYGGSTTIRVNPYYEQGSTDGQFTGALMKWDISSAGIPSDATISAASLSFNVTDGSNNAYNLYNMRRSWVEGTNNGASGTGASWNYYGAGTGSWGTTGAQNTSSDRYETNLWNATASDFNTTGNVTFNLNSSGLAVVQGWIAGTLSNYGLTIQNYSGSATDIWEAASSENSTVANRPKLNITYCVTTTDPTITTSGTLTAFNTQPGVPSTPQTYTVEGENLTTDISIAAPPGFQLSSNGTTYLSSLTLSQSGGLVPSTIVYVRLYNAIEDTYSGNIIHTSSGATTKNVAVSGIVTSCSDVSLVAAEDTYLSANDVTYNNGGNTSLHVDATTGTSRRTALLKWDLSSIPENATISSASLSINVSDASSLVFNLYNLKRSWVEGTGTQETSSDSANWNTYDGVNSWGTAGAANTDSDRYDTNLWNATSSSFSSTGSKTEALNTAGVGVVQGWLDGTTDNYGLIMQNYSGSTNNALFFSSSEATTEANRPKLNITYCAPTGPAITTSGTLTAFSSTPGVPSEIQTYTVSGSNLTDDITITAPPPFEISNDTAFFSSLVLEQTDGLVAPTVISVRLNSETEGTFDGIITHTSAGAEDVDKAVSGSVLPLYTLTVSNDGNGTVSLNPTGGSYSSGATVTLTPVPNSGFVFSSWSGANNGDIVNTGGVYTILMDGDKSITANFVTGTCSTSNLTATEDTYLSANDVTYNNGGNTELHVDGTTGTSRRTSLLKWDLSDIPSNATVSSASLSLYVTDASPLLFNLYNMRRSWIEGTGNRTASTTSANWNTFDGTTSWGTVGAANTSSDRYDTNLWEANTSSFSSTGIKTISLNSYGLAAIQSWISGADNYGLILQNYSGSTSNAVFFSSSEASTTANRPQLNITYCIATTGPTIITTSSLTAFSSYIGVPSEEQSYTVSGINLTDDLTIHAPADFEISKTSGSFFGSTITLPQSSGTVGITTIYIHFIRATPGTSTGNITHTSTGATQVHVPVSGTAANGAPVVSLVQPADNATGVPIPPTLSVGISDPDEDNSNVTFYGRQVGSGTGDDFTIAVIPDPQNLATSYPDVYNSQTQWIVDHKAISNTVFTTAVGDLVNTSSSATEYGRANAAFDILDSGGVPYSVSPGNHDMAMGSTLWPTYFGVSRFSGKSWFGGSLDDYNTYSLFSASGMDFIVINLQYSPTTTQLNWADDLLKDYPNRRGIVVQHNILNTDNSWNSQTSFTALKDNPNLFLMLCGHMHSSGDGAAYRSELGDDGHTIHIVMADYQDFGSNGYMRLLRFSPANDLIYMTTISPSGGSITTSPDKMNLAYDMASSDPFSIIGTVEDVVSGSNANIGWTGLSTDIEYEWYAIANDGTSSTTSSTWSFTTGISGNHAPVITESDPQGVTMSEDGSPYAFNLTLHASDEDLGNILTWSISSPASHGLATASGTGSSKVIGYTPELNYSGSDSFSVQVSDGSAVDTVTVNVVINAVNDPPEITGQSTLSIPEDSSLTITLSDLMVTDVDNSYPTGFSLEVLPGINYSVLGTTLTPEANFNGSLTVPVKVNDGLDNSNTYNLTVSVTPENDIPVANAQSVTTNEDTNKGITLTGTDVETLSLIFTVVDWPQHGAFTGTAPNLTYTPDGDYFGSDSFTFIVNDGTVDSNLATVSITVNPVNDAPAAVDDDYYIPEDTDLILTQLDLKGDDTDVDNSNAELSVIGVSNPSNGTVVLVGENITFTPTTNFAGTAGFDYLLTDGDKTDTGHVMVIVSGVNDIPEIAESDPHEVTMSEDGSPTPFGLTLHATDGDGDTLNWSISTPASHGAASISGTGTVKNISYAPTENYEGSDSFVVQVSDGVAYDRITVNVTIDPENDAPVADTQSIVTSEDTAKEITLTGSDVETSSLIFTVMGQPTHGSLTGTEPDLTYTPDANYNGLDSFSFKVNDGDIDSAIATIFITVDPVNDLPVADGQSESTDEDIAKAITLTGSDVESLSLTYTIVDQPSHGLLSGTAPDLLYTPASNFNGPDSFTFKVEDSEDESTPATVSITVDPVNDEPVADSQSVSTDEDIAKAITLTGSDVDEDILSFFVLTYPTNGILSGTAPNLTYTPNSNVSGSDSFTFKVNDSTVDSADATISITINSVNDAPLAVDDSFNAIEDTMLNLTQTDLMSNDSDVDNSASELSVSAVSNPANGTVKLDGVNITFTPFANFVGIAGFDYELSDGNKTAAGRVTVTVSGVNDAPVIAEGDSVDVIMSNIFTLTLNASDVDGDTLTWSIDTQADNGIATASGTGTSMVIGYTPETGFVGEDSFVVKVGDGNGAVDTILVNVTINPVEPRYKTFLPLLMQY